MRDAVAVRAAAWLELTKPGITLFVGITAATGFLTAAGGWALPGQLAAVLGATVLMSAGAATLNQVAERGRDALMRRTARRPLPAGRVSVREARLLGWGLSCCGLAMSLWILPPATAVWLGLCHVSYVNVYTPLKHRTPLCTLAGAIPGALPVLAGAAATGQPLGPAPLALTAVLFMWQIPHFLAIGWIARDDYRSAACPMLSVVDGTGRSSARVSFVYAGGMLVAAAVLGVVSDAGPLYLGAALLAGGAYTALAWSFVRRPEPLPARRLFLSSLVVLPLLLLALIGDLVVR